MTALSLEDRKERTQAYLDQSLRYLENASKALMDGYPEKSGEFLWGSVATALKALAMAKKGVELNTHGKIWDLAHELARDTEDKRLYKAYLDADSLHKNFYEGELTTEYVKMLAPEIGELITRLKELVEEALQEAASEG